MFFATSCDVGLVDFFVCRTFNHIFASNLRL